MSLKAIGRAVISATLDAAGMIGRSERGSEGSLTVLCYHRILPAGRKDASLLPDLAVTPEGFDAQCAALKRRYDVLPLSEAADLLFEGRAGRMPLAAITFDDGYRDNIRFAAPVLRARGLRATFFAIAGLSGAEEAPWYDRLGRAAASLLKAGLLERGMAGLGIDVPLGTGWSPERVVQAAKRLPPSERSGVIARLESLAGGDRCDPGTDFIMSFEELLSLRREGHEIGAHSMTHEILTTLDIDTASREIAGSKALLEAGTGLEVRSFCYPNGDYDDRILEAVRRAGYSYACTTRSGPNRPSDPPLELSRRFICERRLSGIGGGTSESLFRMELTGLADAAFRRSRARGSHK